MRRLFALMAVLLLHGTLQAQLTDADAKVRYQIIATAYEEEHYLQAYTLSNELMADMKSEPSKLLYMKLKAAYKCLQADSLPKIYKYFAAFSALATAFEKQVANTNYPVEKLQEISTIGKWFQEQATALDYTRGRTPQDAVNFFNDYSKQSSPVYLPGRENGGEMYDSTVYSMVGPVLKIVSYKKPEYPLYDFEYRIDFFDFSKIDTVMKGKYNRIMVGPYYTAHYDQNIYRSNHKVLVQSLAKARNNFDIDTAQVPDPATLAKMKLTTIGDIQHNEHFDFASYFTRMVTKKSLEETNAFRVRLMDALQFLIDYFPKETETPKHKF